MCYRKYTTTSHHVSLICFAEDKHGVMDANKSAYSSNGKYIYINQRGSNEMRRSRETSSINVRSHKYNLSLTLVPLDEF